MCAGALFDAGLVQAAGVAAKQPRPNASHEIAGPAAQWLFELAVRAANKKPRRTAASDALHAWLNSAWPSNRTRKVSTKSICYSLLPLGYTASWSSISSAYVSYSLRCPRSIAALAPCSFGEVSSLGACLSNDRARSCNAHNEVRISVLRARAGAQKAYPPEILRDREERDGEHDDYNE